MEEVYEKLNELEDKISDVVHIVNKPSLSNFRKAIREIPSIINLSFELTKTVVERLEKVEKELFKHD